MRRSKPEQDHTSDAPIPTQVTCTVIGHVRSPYRERFGTPRQPPVTQQTLDDRAQEASIELLPRMNFDQALRDLEDFEYIWVLSWMHLNDGWNPMVTPPRGPKRKLGLFATRAPHRPNPIALSAVKLLEITGRTLRVMGIDLLDGTPVLDLKPYVPYADAFPNARAGWLDQIDQAPDAPDRFEEA